MLAALILNCGRSVPRGCALLGMVLSLAGCSEMKFVNVTEPNSASDPREDIMLSGIQVDMTTSGSITGRVHSNSAVVAQSAGALNLGNVRVESFSKGATTQGITMASRARLYLSDSSRDSRKRRDVVFYGGVHHEVPSPKDPARNTLVLDTEELVWEPAEERFFCPTTYTMTMVSATGNGAPFYQAGESFEVGKDLKRFTVRGGAVSSQGSDPRTSRTASLAQMNVLRQQIEAHDSADKGPSRPSVEVPQVPERITFGEAQQAAEKLRGLSKE